LGFLYFVILFSDLRQIKETWSFCCNSYRYKGYLLYLFLS